jgi:hypothetical protein
LTSLDVGHAAFPVDYLKLLHVGIGAAESAQTH